MSYPSIRMYVLKGAVTCEEINVTAPVLPAVPASESAVSVIPPYATMLGFTRYVTRTGPAKATFVGGLRRARERRSGFNPHGQLVKALKADIAFRTGGGYLSRVTALGEGRGEPPVEAGRAGAP